MALKSITDREFEAEVLHSTLLTLVYFHANWSYACRMVHLSLQTVSDFHDTMVHVVTMDVNECPLTVRELSISHVPSVIYYFEGIDLRRDEGMMTVHFIESKIQELLKKVRGRFVENRSRRLS